VVGVGQIGKVHAENLSRNVPNARLVAISDSNLETAKSVAGETGVERVYGDYHELLKNTEVEAIIVAVPTVLKLEVVKAAAEAGKHIFCEKPMALTLEEADEFIRVTDRAGVKLQVGYQRRFDPSYTRMKEAIDGGEVGKMLLLRSNTRDPPQKVAGWADPKVSGGIFLDTSTHDYDVIRWLSGSEVSRVIADGATEAYPELKKLDDLDTTMSILHLTNGALAHVDACRVSVYGYDIRAEVVGTEGAVFMSIGTSSNTQILTKTHGSNQNSYWYMERFGEAYRRELEEFARAVAGEADVRVNARDGKAAVEIGLAARRSMVEGRSISLPLH
jgi:myo-inositol 2-dehydrogenase/D-chiro-inositol 1-dehydrogenase